MFYSALYTLAGTACNSLTSSQTEKPNILVIVLDDAGYNDFGFMGSKDIQTPNIDNLAKNGVIFRDAHVSATVSGPSRAGILTGRYQQRSGYECNLGDTLGLGLQESDHQEIYFSENGYTTACIGKWHHDVRSEYRPNKTRIRVFRRLISGSRSYFYQPEER